SCLNAQKTRFHPRGANFRHLPSRESRLYRQRTKIESREDEPFRSFQNRDWSIQFAYDGSYAAARRFVLSLENAGLLDRTARVQADLYGSLALTGLGHGTDRIKAAADSQFASTDAGWLPNHLISRSRRSAFPSRSHVPRRRKDASP